MIVYLDASALVKRYVAEAGSRETERLIERANAVATCVISRAEVVAGLARARRMKIISQDDVASALRVFRSQWPDYLRLQVTETLIARADTLAWDQGLRGYDAVHLAAAISWQEAIGDSVSLATFDRQLWSAAGRIGLTPWPELPL